MSFHPFPDDLVTAQRSWTAAYEELARPHATRATVLRRSLLRLSTQVYFHPYWAHPAPKRGGRSCGTWCASSSVRGRPGRHDQHKRHLARPVQAGHLPG
ncbi:hypothetical protein [Streptomyces narbonensis]|uniref:hypothetical protein n=1 Tax=Streptomyces narbonensis TaxID=67333 RepID=UPI0033D43A1F